MVNQDIWEQIKNFYVESFGVESDLVELMANDNILLLCASGASNSKISSILDVDEDSVCQAISEYFGDEFLGWEKNLSINPFIIYQTLALTGSAVSYEIFMAEVVSIDEDFEESLIYNSFLVSKKYFEIDSLIGSDWR